VKDIVEENRNWIIKELWPRRVVITVKFYDIFITLQKKRIGILATNGKRVQIALKNFILQIWNKLILHRLQRWDQNGEAEWICHRLHVQIKQEWMSLVQPVDLIRINFRHGKKTTLLKNLFSQKIIPIMLRFHGENMLCFFFLSLWYGISQKNSKRHFL